MEPLALTLRPPRSTFLQLEGLYVLPRTIDKARAQLPGGTVGSFTIRGSTNLLPGLSLLLLDGIGINEEKLLQAVAEAATEEDICAWLRENGDLSQKDRLNEALLRRSVGDILKVVPIEKVEKTYPFIRSFPIETSTFEVILHDDRLAFPDLIALEDRVASIMSARTVSQKTPAERLS